MTYNSLIPQPTDLISNSQQQILNNFGALATTFAVNHAGYNATNAGKHNFVDLLKQAADPVTINDEIAIFCKEVVYGAPLTNRREWFLRRALNDAAPTYQLSTQDPVASANGQSWLPGGLQIKWGGATKSDGQTVTFVEKFPTQCFVVTLTITDPGATTKILNVRSRTATDFIVNVSVGSVAFFYIAIGN